MRFGTILSPGLSLTLINLNNRHASGFSPKFECHHRGSTETGPGSRRTQMEPPPLERGVMQSLKQQVLKGIEYVTGKISATEGYSLMDVESLASESFVPEFGNQSGGLENSKTRSPVDTNDSTPDLEADLKACCGHYPKRFPFKPLGGTRDCCYTHTFNVMLYECCLDGKTRTTCD